MSNQRLATNPGIYRTEFVEATGVMVRINTETGASWSWKPTPKPPRKTYLASNGLTVEGIRKAGHKIAVMHYRWALYSRHRVETLYGYIEEPPIAVPASFLRRSLEYTVFPNGGYTHIAITTKDGKDIRLSSACSPEDIFCYKAGVQKALQRLTEQEVDLLTNDTARS